MKTIVLYYSLGGSTKVEAEKIADTEDAVTCRVEEVKKRNLFTAFIPGALYAMKRKAVSIKALTYDLVGFDKIIIGMPIWGGFPAPAFNAIVQKLPPEKDVELFFCSGGGLTPKSKQGTMDMIAVKGCKLLSYKDIGTAKKR
jgi:flavodoxin